MKRAFPPAASTLLMAAAGPNIARRALGVVEEDPEEQERRHAREARVRFSRLLGSWRSGWSRLRNLTQWILRAIRRSAHALGLQMTPDGRVFGDHLLAILNRAMHACLLEGEVCALSVGELMRLIAEQSVSDMRIYFWMDSTSGIFWVGCFHGILPMEEGKLSFSPCFEEVDTLVFGRAQLLLQPFAPGDQEACLLRVVATQPLNAIVYTYRYWHGELHIQRHARAFSYRPLQTPLLLDDIGAPFGVATPCVRVMRTQMYVRITSRLLGDIGAVLHVAPPSVPVDKEGIKAAADSAETHLWAQKLIPLPQRDDNASRFYVDVMGAMRREGLVFYMAHNGVIIGPPVIPACYLHRAQG